MLPSVDALILTFGVVLPLVAPMFVRKFDCGAMVDRAAKRAAIDRKNVAEAMGIRDSQLSQQIHGCSSEHLSFDRLTRLPEKFWAALSLELGEYFGWVDCAESRDRRVARRMVQRTTDRVHEERPSAA